MTTELPRTSKPAGARPRPAAGAPGAKLLITVGTIAATVFGWTTLTEQNRLSLKEAAPVEPAVAVTGPTAAQQLAASLQPIPTLVPQPAISGAAIVAAQPGAAPVVQSAPAVVVQAAPALRVVSAPPAAPVTTTRSSR